MTDLKVPDISEFQTVHDFGALSKACPVIIARAHNGWRADYHIAAWLPQLRYLFQVRMFYGYLPASVDPTAAAHGMQAVTGPLQPNEAFVLDLEEGAGDQRARMYAYLKALGDTHDWVYSGMFFARSHLPGVHVQWLAAYQGSEPTDVHQLWQFSDAVQFPGIAAPCDASVYHGTIDDLKAALGWGVSPVGYVASQEEEAMWLLKDPDSTGQYLGVNGTWLHIATMPELTYYVSNAKIPYAPLSDAAKRQIIAGLKASGAKVGETR